VVDWWVRRRRTKAGPLARAGFVLLGGGAAV